MRFRDRLQQFMAGRNGFDGFSNFLLYVGLGALVLGMILVRVPYAGRIMNVIGFLTIIYMYYRVFSKNRQKRIAENYKYYEILNKVKDFFKYKKSNVYTQKPVKPVRDPNYKYFKCPSCKKTVKVPKNHGKIEIICRNCQTKFIRFTGKRQ